jgi:NAD(P)-dependent dehydrogenase (short-subunit alcohol dehydrogenase family)
MAQRIAIITGAARRVGRIIAEELLADGWTVVAHVHSSEDEAPHGAIKVAADLADADCAQAIFEAAPGTPLLLVNNAARFAHDDLAAFSADEFDAHMAVNVRAPALLTAAFAKAYPSGTADRLIVNILDAKLAAPNPDYLSYTLSKAALESLTVLSAPALAGQGIRVNAIAPALMLRSPGQTEENFAAAHAHNPLSRGVDPKDIVRALRFMLDSPVLTGEVLTLDAGQRFLSLPRDVQFLDL